MLQLKSHGPLSLAQRVLPSREDEAAAQLASGESFRRRVRATMGQQGLASSDSPAAAERNARPKRTKRAAGQRRPQLVNASTLGTGVSHLPALFGMRFRCWVLQAPKRLAYALSAPDLAPPATGFGNIQAVIELSCVF